MTEITVENDFLLMTGSSFFSVIKYKHYDRYF